MSIINFILCNIICLILTYTLIHQINYVEETIQKEKEYILSLDIVGTAFTEQKEMLKRCEKK